MQKLGGKGASGRSATRKLTVPAYIASVVPDDTLFQAELTEEGILFRVLASPPSLPSWVATGVVQDSNSAEREKEVG